MSSGVDDECKAMLGRAVECARRTIALFRAPPRGPELSCAIKIAAGKHKMRATEESMHGEPAHIWGGSGLNLGPVWGQSRVNLESALGRVGSF